MKSDHADDTRTPGSDLRDEGASSELEPRTTYEKPTLEHLGDWGIFNKGTLVLGS